MPTRYIAEEKADGHHPATRIATRTEPACPTCRPAAGSLTRRPRYRRARAAARRWSGTACPRPAGRPVGRSAGRPVDGMNSRWEEGQRSIGIPQPRSLPDGWSHQSHRCRMDHRGKQGMRQSPAEARRSASTTRAARSVTWAAMRN